jgi:hypothetical protein
MPPSGTARLKDLTSHSLRSKAVNSLPGPATSEPRLQVRLECRVERFESDATGRQRRSSDQT